MGMQVGMILFCLITERFFDGSRGYILDKLIVSSELGHEKIRTGSTNPLQFQLVKIMKRYHEESVPSLKNLTRIN
jgi:hypothetical protein